MSNSIGSPEPCQIRDEFRRMIVDDLYGPAGGIEEQLTEYRPLDRYLVGMLAPRSGTAATAPELADDGLVHEEDGDEAFADASAAANALFPSSKGISFAVPANVGSIAVSATWGRYTREDIEIAAAPEPDAKNVSPENSSQQGSVIKGWQRHPAGGTRALELSPEGGEVEVFSIDAEHPDVTVSGRATVHGTHLLVSLFLVNNQPPQKSRKDEAWLFQAELSVASVDGAPIFVGRDKVLDFAPIAGSDTERQEIAALDMQYRRHVEFAVGHGTAVHCDADPMDPSHASRLTTITMPLYEVPRTDAPRPDEPGLPDLTEVTFDMKQLAEAANPAQLVVRLADAYDEWLDAQESRIDEPDLVEHRMTAMKAIADARTVAKRLRAGIDLLTDPANPEAVEAFRFANWSMWTQRVRTLAADRARRTGDSLEDCLTQTDVPGNRSWRPFQLAFILLNLPSLTDPSHQERSTDPLVDLLFFPTGGGKTEAYLGLTAYTFAIRRLQGTRFGRDGSDGVAVLMRYTLRLLTAQQFQRAAALVAACEVRRRELLKSGDLRWGTAPFRIGLWVGSGVTPNTASVASKVVTSAKASGFGGMGRANPVQLTNCPWCGASLSMAADAKADPVLWRTLLHCSDNYGDCPFTAAGEERDGISREGIPVITVDDEIYRLLPSLVISTADKFAQLPWQGPLHMLFGSVTRKCTRHGYRSPDLDKSGDHSEADRHAKSGDMPAATTVDVTPLRPVDLIIQDELHLISGPLGSLTGLYETAIDALATWDCAGVKVRPKVIASTATVRRAADQVHALFARRLSVFPPPVLDISNNFFSVQRPTAEDPADPSAAWAPGRLYIGVCGFGHRLKAVQARVFITLLAAGAKLFERYGDDADPYLTMIGYYNALRELAGGRRLIDDDVRSRLAAAKKRGLGLRKLRVMEELTSRKSSSEIPATLEQLGTRFTKEGEDAFANRKAKSNEAPDAGLTANYRPIDVLLATNMISVGVDVSRLGLMAAVGQPKATSEYIQATSRVGRSAEGPGLVLTIYNWARPRDLSHFESFEHYHATFYKSVEALSVTPFAPRAIDRGLTGVLVSLVRHAEASGAGSAWNPESGAQVVPGGTTPEISTIGALIAARSQQVTGDPQIKQDVQDAINLRLTSWAARQKKATSQGAKLTYRGKGGDSEALLRIPAPGKWDEWSCPNSLRETEANINLQIDLWDKSLDDAASFKLTGKAMPTAQDGDVSESMDFADAAAATAAVTEEGA